MSIKVLSYALIWFGVVALLSSLRLIPINGAVLLSVAMIVAGLSLKHYNHSMTCLLGGKCESCGRDHKCKGEACNVCK